MAKATDVGLKAGINCLLEKNAADIEVTASEATTTAIPFPYRGIAIRRKSGSAVTLTVYGSNDIDGTFLAVYDDAGVAVTVNLSTIGGNGWVGVKLGGAFPLAALKFVGDAACVIEYSMKG